jgi:acyl-CoA thioesterase II
MRKVLCEKEKQMSQAVSDMLNILDIEQLEVNLFRGISPQNGWFRVFGGQVIAQALVAASRTIGDKNRTPHSLHAYFILGGDPKVPIIYEVERIRDGKSFSTRRVLAIQHGEAIFALSCSYHGEEYSFEHQGVMPPVTMPEDLPSMLDLKNQTLPSIPDTVRSYYARERPIELRPVEFGRYMGQRQVEGKFNVWFRATAPLPDDASVHRAVLAYASDMSLLDAALVPHGRTVFEKDIQAASLDHALWFHRPFKADDWLLYAQDSPSMTNAKGFSRGQIFTREGVLVASVAQEGLLRLKKEV